MSIQQAKIPFQYEDYQQLVEQMSPAFTPAYMHGIVWAMLAVFGGSNFADNVFLKKLTEDEAALFEKLYVESISHRSDQAIGIHLLLPADEAPLSQRLEALRDWCEGFLQGIQLAQPSDAQLVLTQSSQDIIKDIENISGLNCDEVSTEENEKYYMELIEFLRVAVMLLVENQDEALAKPEETPVLH